MSGYDRIQAVAVASVGEKISFASGYGATETGPTASNVHWTNGRMGMIGLPVPGTSVRLVPTGDKLEFRVRGPQVSSGYLHEPELSAQAFDDEGLARRALVANAFSAAKLQELIPISDPERYFGGRGWRRRRAWMSRPCCGSRRPAPWRERWWTRRPPTWGRCRSRRWRARSPRTGAPRSR